MHKQPFIYILASGRNGTLYVGVTGALSDRMSVHTQDLNEGFTKKYGVHCLVYYEWHETFDEAFRREKQLKGWKRAWKIRLIEQMNPDWADLYDALSGEIRDGPADLQRQNEKDDDK